MKRAETEFGPQFMKQQGCGLMGDIGAELELPYHRGRILLVRFAHDQQLQQYQFRRTVIRPSKPPQDRMLPRLSAGERIEDKYMLSR